MRSAAMRRRNRPTHDRPSICPAERRRTIAVAGACGRSPARSVHRPRHLHPGPAGSERAHRRRCRTVGRRLCHRPVGPGHPDRQDRQRDPPVGRHRSDPGKFDFSPASSGENLHGSIAAGPDGKVYVSDLDNHRVQVFTADGEFIRQFGSFGTEPGQFQIPFDLNADGGGNVYVIDDGLMRLTKFTPSGNPAWVVDEHTDPLLAGHGHTAAVDAQGRVVMVIDDTSKVVFVSPDGKVVDSFDAGGCSSTVDATGDTYVAGAWTRSRHRLRRTAPEDWRRFGPGQSPLFGPGDEVVALGWDGSVNFLKVTLTAPWTAPHVEPAPAPPGGFLRVTARRTGPLPRGAAGPSLRRRGGRPRRSGAPRRARPGRATTRHQAGPRGRAGRGRGRRDPGEARRVPQQLVVLEPRRVREVVGDEAGERDRVALVVPARVRDDVARLEAEDRVLPRQPVAHRPEPALVGDAGPFSSRS